MSTNLFGLKEFNGDNLIRGINLRGMNNTDFCHKVGITRQMLSLYKTGKVKNVSDEIVDNFSDVLNIPRDYFYADYEPAFQGPIHFRARTSARKHQQIALKTKVEAVEKIRQYLDDYVTFPKMDLPDCSKMTPQDAAKTLRKFWRLGNEPIKNIITLAEQHGIIVVRLHSDGAPIDAFTVRQAKDEVAEPHCYIVYAYETETAVRIHFDIAHELGHLCMHQNRIFDDIMPEEHGKLETEANVFASEFLIPEETFKIDVPTDLVSIPYLTRLKEKWFVSVQAMLYRCKELNIISDNAYVEFIKLMQRRGIMKSEPSDDVLQTAGPCIIRDAVMLLLTEGGFDGERLIEDIQKKTELYLYPEDYEKLMDLKYGTLVKQSIKGLVSLKE